MATIIEDNGDAGADYDTQYTISLGDIFQGSLETENDVDYVRVELAGESDYEIRLTGVDSPDVDIHRQGDMDTPGLTANGFYLPFDSRFIFKLDISYTYYIEVKSDDTNHSGDYQLTITEYTPSIATYDDIAGALYAGRNQPPIAFDVGPGGELTVDITGLSDNWQKLTRLGLEAWSDVTGIIFELVDNENANIFFDDEEHGNYATPTSTKHNTLFAAHVNFSNGGPRSADISKSPYAFYVVLHEIGHALGFDHPGPDYGFTPPIFLNDSWQATVMSYYSQDGLSDINASYAIPVTPMIADIIAIHKLYGAPTDIRSGDTVYGYRSNVDGYLDNIFKALTGDRNPFYLIDGGTSSEPEFSDLDGDGDFDLILGSFEGPIHYYENIGTNVNPSFTQHADTTNPLYGIGTRNDRRSKPVLVDLDGDNDLDLIIVFHSDSIRYYKNNGTSDSPDFTPRSYYTQPFEEVDTSYFSTFTFADLDGDNDLDLAVGNGEGGIDYYENTGTATEPDFTQRTGTANPLDVVDVIHSNSPVFNDLDGDGDFDLIVAQSGSNIHYFENTGTATNPDFTQRSGADNPLESVYIQSSSSLAFADVDADGDPDAVFGDSSGKVFYLENTGTRTDPSFAERSLRNDIALTLYDNGGNDTLDLRTDIHDQRVDLRSEGISDVYGLVGNLVIARDTLIENFIAGSGNDEIIGNATANRLVGGNGDDWLQGNGGSDMLEGGAGSDTASYTGSDAGVVVRLHSFLTQGGHAEGDTFVGRVTVDNTEVPDIEHLTGSSHDDTLAGDLRDNTLKGRAGDDTIYGGPGGGDDRMYGENGNDRIFGGQGDDTIIGGAGADRLNGGVGEDTAAYTGSDAGVVVRLHSFVAQGGHAEDDTFIGRVTVDNTEVPDVEHLTGSSHDDILAGDLRDNTLKGRAGDDTIYGGPGGGDDRLYGENGNDRIFGGQGDDTIIGGAGDDTLSGGPDDDTFVFAPGGGDDTIMDFENRDDRIDLSAFTDIDSLDDLSMEQQGNDVVVDVSGQGGGTIILSDFDITHLDASDFIF